MESTYKLSTGITGLPKYVTGTQFLNLSEVEQGFYTIVKKTTDIVAVKDKPLNKELRDLLEKHNNAKRDKDMCCINYEDSPENLAFKVRQDENFTGDSSPFYD